ncbi:hypothetical protein IFR04_006912 [Cadophora malorum]|uniref:Zn(2)-C6 fungal-type domain-containing protein n=1 Tax=Cadophora malorum TaxID=108018 RepID=A0A8H7TIR4_9HELO|nr:hypothetical protein IFR04_006912 [Cadophora malorum]
MNSSEKTSYASSRASSYDNPRKKTHTRRPHRKTKTGCLTCKKRKIKCDETRPECGNCIKHTLECVYALSKVQVTSTSLSDGAHDLNLVDLEFLHNYCTSTALTLHRDPPTIRLWSITVPEFGFIHDYVMHGILALSALHLGYCHPERKEFCTRQATLHHKLGLEKATPALSAFSEENATAMYLFSALTCLYTYMTIGQTDDSVLGGESSWIFLSRQSYSLIRMADKTLRKGPLGPLLAAGERRTRLRDMVAESPACFVEADRLEELSARIDESVSDPEAKEAYNAAISDMLRILKVMYSLPEEGRELSDVFRWPFQLSVGFMDLLQTPTQECLAVIAHFAIIPEFLSSKWWLEGFGRRLLAKLYPLIDEEHLSWIQWPMQQLGISSEGGFPTSSYGTPMDIGT